MNDQSPWHTRSVAAAAIVVAAACIVGLWYARSFVPFMADDAFISLRYADRLLAGKGLTWTDFERVEGYSNLLWVLATAAFSAVSRLDLVSSARMVGALSMVGAVSALVIAFPPRTPAGALSLLAGALALTASAPSAVWTIGGLEQPLAAGLLACGLWGVLGWLARPQRPRSWLLPSAALALLALTRPDGILLAAAVALSVPIGSGSSRRSWRFALQVLSLPLAFVLLQLLFRLGYYGDWVPNTAHAKLSLTRERLHSGVDYLLAGARALPLLGVALLLGLFALVRGRRPEATVVLVPFLGWAGYVVLIGGDIFPAYRHLVVLLVMAAFLLVIGLRASMPAGATMALAGAAVPACALLAFLPGHRDPEVERARTERWEWEGERVGHTLARAFGQIQPLLAADPAGCLPYFSRLPSIDMLGLNDRYLGQHPPADLGRGYLGHELGDGDYFLRRHPDLVVFCGPLGSRDPCFRGGRELVARPGWRRSYRSVLLETLPPMRQRALIWVRTDGRLGPSQSADQVRIPGLVMTADPPLVNQLADDGAMRTLIPAGRAALGPPLPLSGGVYQVTAVSDGSMLLRVLGRDIGLQEEQVDGVRFTLPKPADVEIEAVAPPASPRSLQRVLVQRLGDQPSP